LYPIAYVLERKYFADDIYFQGFSMGARRLGNLLWRFVDDGLIDGLVVNGSARTVRVGSSVLRHLQSGYLYHYAFAMVIGIAVMVGWLVWR
ncbi:MAG: NADH-quinone oxidoreductase subunit L, partial [Gammaproteobacteria bacterium]